MKGRRQVLVTADRILGSSTSAFGAQVNGHRYGIETWDLLDSLRPMTM